MQYTLFDLAKDVLKNANEPLTYHEIWNLAVEYKIDQKLNSKGKTPWQSLGARLFVDVRDNSNSDFIKVGQRPARFFLKSRKNELSEDIIIKLESKDIVEDKNKDTNEYTERDLHPLLSYFIYSNPSFSGAKGIISKTIFHEKSKKKGFNEWLHPDMVGFYIPIDDWNNDLIEFNKISEKNIIRLYSFEIKKYISKANYRESYFQAVSNSSWANEGYLVTAKLQKDDDLLSELERLNMSFGIGLILLDLEDIDASDILFPSKIKNYLDWETMNKLSEQNSDFCKFIQDVKIDYESKRIHKSEYDKIIEDIDTYLEKIKKGKKSG